LKTQAFDCAQNIGTCSMFYAILRTACIPEFDMELEPFVDATTAANFLNLRPRRILELARQGSIPAYPVGNGQRRVWRFRLSEVASALVARAVQSCDAAVRTGKEIH